MKVFIILAFATVFILLLTACNITPVVEEETTMLQKRIHELETLGVSITTIPVSVFSDYDFCAIPVAVTIRLEVNQGAEWGVVDESGVQFVVNTIVELADYSYEKRIPFGGISGMNFGAFHDALALQRLSDTFLDMLLEEISEHPVIEVTVPAFYNAIHKIDEFLNDGNMHWLEEHGIEVILLFNLEHFHPPRSIRDIAVTQFVKLPGIPFGITDQASLELFMDAATLMTVMHLGRWPDIDESIMNTLAMHRGLDGRSLRVLFYEGMETRLREIYQ